jgi:hypothetical protein
MYPYDLDAAGLSNREGMLCELKLWLPPPCLSLAGEAGRCSDPCGGLPLPFAQAVHGSRLIFKPCCPLSHLKPWLVDTMHRTHKQPHLRAVTEHLGFMEKASPSPGLPALRSTFSTFQHPAPDPQG